MAKVMFYTATAAQFAALETKDEKALYFITDTGELYKGNVRFGFPVKLVESFPETGEAGLLYVNSDGLAKIWDGTQFMSVGGNPLDVFLSTAVRHTVTSAEAGKGIYADMVENDIGVLFTLTNDSQLFVKLTDLVDTYTADNTSAKGAAVTVDGYKISAEVNVSAETGNLIQLKDDGVYVPQMEWQTLPE